MSRVNRKASPDSGHPDAFSHMHLTAFQRASARARMAQAEAIADGVAAVYRAVAAAAQHAAGGLAAAARRVRSVFMKPAHR